MTAAARRRAGYQDVLDSDPRVVAEVVEGVLYTQPRPALPHAQVASELTYRLVGPFRHGRVARGGWHPRGAGAPPRPRARHPGARPRRMANVSDAPRLQPSIRGAAPRLGRRDPLAGHDPDRSHREATRLPARAGLACVAARSSSDDDRGASAGRRELPPRRRICWLEPSSTRALRCGRARCRFALAREDEDSPSEG